ncbi:MAG: hypothetical protein R2912_11950 [Eubacteriales bacterium]
MVALLAFYIAWMGVITCSQLLAKHYRRASCIALLFLGVMFSLGIPWVVYFAANGGLQDFVHYYFYQNMFGYSYLADPVLPNMILAIVKGVGAFSYRNPQISLLIVLGFAWLLTRKKERAVKPIENQRRAALWLARLRRLYGRAGIPCYGLVLTPFMALGVAPIGRLLAAGEARITAKRWLVRSAFGLLSLAMLALALFTSDNRYMLKIRREDTPQASFRAHCRNAKRRTGCRFCAMRFGREVLSRGGCDSGLSVFCDFEHRASRNPDKNRRVI